MEDYTTKVCSKCKQTKPLSDFHRDKTTPDGYYGQCKLCKNARHSLWRAEHREEERARSREYTRSHRDEMTEYMRQWRARNPDYIRDRRMANYEVEAQKLRDKKHTVAGRARNRFTQAVLRGKITKPTHCEHCGCEPGSQHLVGHHDDYSKPFDVVWLCRICHGKQHRHFDVVQ